jgi:hypothetical protein
MKGVDPECVTRESSVVVAEALEALVNNQDGLFG